MKMTNQRVIRGLVLLDATATVAAVITAIVLEDSLPEPLRNYVNAEEPNAFFLGIALVLLVVMVVAWVGLWLQRPWARTAYAAYWIGSVIAVPFGGVYVGTGIEEVFDYVSTSAGGAILALLFVRPYHQPVADAAAESERPAPAVEPHIKTSRVHRGLSWLFAFLGLMLLLLPFMALASGENGTAAEFASMFIFPAGMWSLSLFHHFVGRAARERKPWARIASMCSAALMLFAVPLGTMIAVYLFANRTWSPALDTEP